VVRATGDRGLSRALAWCEIALSLLLFVVSTLYIRRRLRSTRAAA
jgi:uncharacterized membrane protein